MTEKFSHKALAEAHNFIVRLAFRIKVRTALATADWQTCKRIFENLLKSKEFKNAEIDTWVETKTALVRSNCTIHLDTISTIDLYFAFIILPRYTESNNALRFNHALQEFNFLILWIAFKYRNDSSQNFFDCILEFDLIWVTLFNEFKNVLYVLFHICHK